VRKKLHTLALVVERSRRNDQRAARGDDLERGSEQPVAVGAPALALGTHSEVHGRNADPARHMVGLATDGVTADWKRSKNAGVEFVEDPTDYGTLRIATLKDPEGNLVQLLQPLRA
jgi:hypothetical protein